MALGNLAAMARLDRLTMAIGEDSFGTTLLETVHAVGDVDHVIVFAFDNKLDAPAAVVNAGCIDAAVAEAAAVRYAAELHLQDPSRDAIIHHVEGATQWFNLDSEQNFSEAFCAAYFAPCDIADMVSFAVTKGDVTYLMQFMRIGGVRFASAHRWLLHQLGEVLAAHVRKHFSYMHAAQGHNQFLIARVLAESPLFATTSPRERLVCIGVLTGHTSESIARNLSISINSVLTYRRRLYEKLGISSQNELFVQIIDAMMSLSRGGEQHRLPPSLETASVLARKNGRPLAANLSFAQGFI